MGGGGAIWTAESRPEIRWARNLNLFTRGSVQPATGTFKLLFNALYGR
jgi:hypothetical protein